MKYAVAVLLGLTQAVKLEDAPPAFNQPTWNERMPSGAGLQQMTPPDFREPVDPSKHRWAWNETMKSSTGLEQTNLIQTACDLNQTEGVSCQPNQINLAQADPVGANQAATADVRKNFNNKGYPQPEKVLVLDPKIARTHTSFYAQADPVGANQAATADVRKNFNNKGYPQPEKVLVLDPKIARTHTSFYAQGDPNPADVKEDKLPMNQRLNNQVRKAFQAKGYPEPEKDLTLDPKQSRVHTSFYAQVAGDDKKEEEPMGINQMMSAEVKKNYTTKGYGEGPEKDLIEDPKIARRSTTFYAQVEGDDKKEEFGINQQMTKDIKYTTAGYGEGPEKDLIEDPKIARRSTTFYAQVGEDDYYGLKKGLPEQEKGVNQEMTDEVRKNYNNKGYGEPEKDLIEDPKIGRTSSTFFAQVAGDDKKEEEPMGINQQMTKAIKYTTAGYGEGPEKDLIEDPKIARRSTTFFAQADPVGANQAATADVRKNFNNKGYPQPEKVLVLDPKIARTHTSFYAQGI